MGAVSEFEREKLIVGVIYNDMDVYRRAIDMLTEAFGEIEDESEHFSFSEEFSDYYDEELGGCGMRVIFSFKNTVEPDRQAEIKKAVAAGYWQLYRYNPEMETPLTVDSKDPTASYQDFIRGENRYASLLRQFPDVAPELFALNQADAVARLEAYKKLAD